MKQLPTIGVVGAAVIALLAPAAAGAAPSTDAAPTTSPVAAPLFSDDDGGTDQAWDEAQWERGLLAGESTLDFGPAASGGGWNDWSCEPSADKPRPIVLLHGLGGQKVTNWFYHAPKLANEGFCVYSFTYGGIIGDFVGGASSMTESVNEVDSFVDEVRASTGVEEVDIVGHSQGTTLAAYYVKSHGGADKVHSFVGFGSNFEGTTLLGLSAVIYAVLPFLPDLEEFVEEVCGSCLELLADSDFIEALNAGGLTVPGVEYTSIISRNDIVVSPYTAGVIDDPAATNITLQDVCPLDLSGHLAMAVSPNVNTLIVRALDPAAAEQPMRCRLALPIPLDDDQRASTPG